jgi:hypothetical protein
MRVFHDAGINDEGTIKACNSASLITRPKPGAFEAIRVSIVGYETA